ncbi:MAG: hypothetical protein K2H47_08845 [Muribaculaceae bacterium]|nr:hypothetical protein [Muribaculaceae bacterium]
MRKFILTTVLAATLTSVATAFTVLPPVGFRAPKQVKTIGQPFDYVEQVNQKKEAPIFKESVSHPDYIITQPEGELRNYVRKGTAITSYLGGTQEVSQDGMTMKVVFAEDGKTVWFYELVSTAAYCFGWIRGEREGNQITIPGGQYAWYYYYDGDYYTAYTVTPIKENPEGEIGGYDWYQCIKGDIVFKIDDFDVLTLVPEEGTSGIGLCRETTDPFLVENGYDGKWLGYADLTTEYIPIEVKFNEAPADDIVRESYYMNYDLSAVTGSSGSQIVTVAIDGNKMYIQGLMDSTFPDSWLIGEIDGNKVNFSSGQMIGIMDRRYVYYVGVKEYDMSWEIIPTFTMSYDKETGVITFPDWILINAFPDNELLYCDGLHGIEMHPFNDVPVIPANPVVGEEYYPFDDMMQSMQVSFMIPPIGKEGEEINPSQLGYEIFVDGELFTFEPNLYYIFIEPVTLIPYGFYDGYYFMQSYMEDNTVLISFFNPEYKSFGARSVYFGGNERRESEIITFTTENTGIGMTEIKSSTLVETLYFDMMGRRIEQPKKGVAVEVKRFDDGTTISRKITVH